MARSVWTAMIGVGIGALGATSSYGQSPSQNPTQNPTRSPAQSPAQSAATGQALPTQCRDLASILCRDALWEQAFSAFQKGEKQRARTLLLELLKRKDIAEPGNEELRASALQILATVALGLQDIKGSKEAGRQALAIWERRANPADTPNRLSTQLNYATALALSEDFSEAETLVRRFVTQIGPLRPENARQHIKATEVLATIHAGRKGPVGELVRLRMEIVEAYRAQTVPVQDAALQRFVLARALANLGDAQIVARETGPAQESLSEAQALLVSISLPESDADWVTLRSRYLILLIAQGDQCGAQAMAQRVIGDAEPRGGRTLSQALIQSGEIYRSSRAFTLTVPLWSRATELELAMACPPIARDRGNNQIGCVGSPLLIDHLHRVGMDLRYEGQGRPSAGYRSLVHAGDFLRTRNLARFSLNRDASTAYAASRVIFRDQITAAWAINDASVVPKTAQQAWTCQSPR